MAKKDNNKKSFISSPTVGAIITLLANILILGVIVVLGRYMSIANEYFVIGIGGAIVAALIINIFFLLGYAKRIRFFRNMLVIFGVIIILFTSVAAYYSYSADASIDQLINKTGVEDVELVLLAFNEEDTQKNMDNKSVGYVVNSDKVEETIKNNMTRYSRTVVYKEYQNYGELLTAVSDKEVQYAVVPRNYTRLNEVAQLEVNPLDKAEELFIFNTKIESSVGSKDVLKEPFTLLITGLNDGLSDSIILASFNPQTLKATMTSVSRDSYVPIQCYPNKSFDKINHSRGVSRQCLIDTVESFLDEKVDYYFETDFYALVKIVDALGGLEITSPITFAGSLPIEGTVGTNEKNMEGITVPEGTNVLDGKQVITFARERHHFANGDFQRQLNQQYVIKELANKIISTRDPNTLLNVLNAAKDNMETSLPKESMVDLLGFAISNIDQSPVDPMSTFRITQTQIAGTTPLIKGASVVLPYKKDVELTRKVIDENMLTEPVLHNDYEFSFNANKPYTTNFIDADSAGGAGASFYNYDQPGNSKTNTRTVKETDSDSKDSKKTNNQSTQDNKTANNNNNNSNNNNSNNTNTEKPKETTLKAPDFATMSKDDIRAWGTKHNVKINFEVYETSEPQFDDGQYYGQYPKPDMNVDGSISVKYVKKKSQ